jgi:hypothetical protein
MKKQRVFEDGVEAIRNGMAVRFLGVNNESVKAYRLDRHQKNSRLAIRCLRILDGAGIRDRYVGGPEPYGKDLDPVSREKLATILLKERKGNGK